MAPKKKQPDDESPRRPIVRMVGEINQELLYNALKKMVLAVMQELERERHDDKQKEAEVPVLRNTRSRSRATRKAKPDESTGDDC